MSDQLDQQHARVGLDLLEANTALAGRVHDGVVPNPTPLLPYLLVYTFVRWSSDPDAAASTLGGASHTCYTTWYVHCVAETAAGCRAMTAQARAALLDQLPLSVPDGRACTPIVEDDAQAPVKDETTGAAVMDAVLVFSMISVPG